MLHSQNVKVLDEVKVPVSFQEMLACGESPPAMNFHPYKDNSQPHLNILIFAKRILPAILTSPLIFLSDKGKKLRSKWNKIPETSNFYILPVGVGNITQK